MKRFDHHHVPVWLVIAILSMCAFAFNVGSAHLNGTAPASFFVR